MWGIRSLTIKYGPVIDLCNRFNMKDAEVLERDEGYLKFTDTLYIIPKE